MENVYVASDNIITPLGFTSEENLTNIKNDRSGISLVNDPEILLNPFFASVIEPEKLNLNFQKLANPDNNNTHFEKLTFLSITDALSRTEIDYKSHKTLFILSTTKGNIDVLEERNKNKFEEKRSYLWHTAKLIQEFFHNPNTPVVVSNACTSGLLAIITGCRMIRENRYKNIVITGADIISGFVASGFQSFQALSNIACKPFDKSRNGLNLGEGCGTIILTSNKDHAAHPIVCMGVGFTSNDANHISGPSKTGDGIYLAIRKTLEHPLSPPTCKVDFISAHGTATIYNDEMEAVALSRCGLKDVPVNSFKGYWGHTLGAAGIIESIASIYCLKNNLLVKTAGFEELGVTEKINIIDKTEEKEIKTCLKIASGFGGCNASLIFYKR
jgi:3-oxoacyl-[acyl-carrier-protein] synthase I